MPELVLSGYSVEDSFVSVLLNDRVYLRFFAESLSMALYSLIIQSGDKSFSMQITASSAALAFQDLVNRYDDMNAQQALGEFAPPQLSSDDMIYLIRLDGLTNAWAGSVGRDGKYISVTLFRTVMR